MLTLMYFLQEAICCDKVFHSGRHPSSENHSGHITRVFTKLMLEGNVRATVCWITKCAGGGLLKFSDSIPILYMGLYQVQC